MNPMSSEIKKLPVQPLDELLYEILRIRRLSNFDLDVIVPELTLYLKNGQTIKGRILDINSFNGERMLLIQSTVPSEYKSISSATYLKMETVEGVTVHNIEEVAFLLSFGRLSAPVESAPLNRKEVESKCIKYAQFFKQELETDFNLEVNFSEVEEDSDEMLQLVDRLRDALIGLYEFILSIEDIEKLKAALRQVKVIPSKKLNVVFDQNTLSFHVPLKSSRKKGETPADIKLKIENGLKSVV